ncbi:MAG TPA: hypothetical protein VNO56_09400 [Gaiellaceae bacterium]|nr:hypothetical protein [Gaiellaceae bacterium]
MAPRLALLVALGSLALAVAPAAAAQADDETALAELYAPVVRLVEQEEECGPGEPYEPMDVEALFDEPTVALRGPWGGGDLVEIGPAASDLADGLYEYHLDFPGHALDPRCDYELWARRVTEGRAPAVYAHVATDPAHPGRLALQYWLFYAYNDWNNLHEGDWEMIQLVFDAPTAREALERRPTAVGYSQHEGAEEADWGDDKLELVDGTHPVVYPAAGSHANFFEAALFIGTSAEQGVGCDDTTGPSVSIRPAVFTIPSDPDEAQADFPWIDFEGRWGELQRAFFNGPTGPNLKRQWTEPIQWSEGWRDRSYAVPGGGAFGTGATDFFCDAVAGGSRALVRLVDEPSLVLVTLAALILLVLILLSRATWRPVAPFRLARRRAWGQILAASGRMYVRRLPLLLGIGVLAIPISLLVTLLQALVLGASRVAGIETEGESRGLLTLIVVAIGTTLTLLVLGLVQAATVRALVELDAGRATGTLHAYRLAFDSVLPLLGALAIAVVAVTVLATSVFLLPVALWLAVRWALVVPVVELEELAARDALRRSARLVRGRWLKVASLALVGGAVVLAAGPLVGALLIVVTNAPFWILNVVAGVVYALTMPFVALTTAYLYFDARASGELTPERDPDELPAEIELAG